MSTSLDDATGNTMARYRDEAVATEGFVVRRPGRGARFTVGSSRAQRGGSQKTGHDLPAL